MTTDFFADYKNATVWYHPIADRVFIFHKATFLMLPCLEREDGIKMIMGEPADITKQISAQMPELEYIGEL
jgi:hypothetical protein